MANLFRLKGNYIGHVRRLSHLCQLGESTACWCKNSQNFLRQKSRTRFNKIKGTRTILNPNDMWSFSLRDFVWVNKTLAILYYGFYVRFLVGDKGRSLSIFDNLVVKREWILFSSQHLKNPWNTVKKISLLNYGTNFPLAMGIAK